jgi:hypothetical protein
LNPQSTTSNNSSAIAASIDSYTPPNPGQTTELEK